MHEHMRLEMFASAEPLRAEFARVVVGFFDMALLVIFQIPLAAVKLPAYLAAVGLLSSVKCLVIQHVLFDLELLVAHRAAIVLVDRSAPVSTERTLAGESLLTARACNRLFCCVKTFVVLQGGLKYKRLGTYITFEELSSGVHCRVSDQAAPHRETFITVGTFVMFHVSPNMVNILPPQFKRLATGFTSEQTITRWFHIHVRINGCVLDGNI